MIGGIRPCLSMHLFRYETTLTRCSSDFDWKAISVRRFSAAGTADTSAQPRRPMSACERWSCRWPDSASLPPSKYVRSKRGGRDTASRMNWTCTANRRLRRRLRPPSVLTPDRLDARCPSHEFRRTGPPLCCNLRVICPEHGPTLPRTGPRGRLWSGASRRLQPLRHNEAITTGVVCNR